MRRYGTDKPDLRFGLHMADISSIVAKCGFQVFVDTITGGGIVKALRIPQVRAAASLACNTIHSCLMNAITAKSCRRAGAQPCQACFPAACMAHPSLLQATTSRCHTERVRVQGKRLSNSRIKPKGDVCQAAMDAGAQGLAFLRVGEGNALEGAKALREGLSDEQAQQLLDTCGAEEGDLLLIVAGLVEVTNRCALYALKCFCITRDCTSQILRILQL